MEISMNEYFWLTFLPENKYDPYGIAYAPKGTDQFIVPFSGNEVKEWKEIEFELRDGIFADYLANNKGIRLCSEDLRKIIDVNLSEQDKIQWLPISIKDVKINEVRNYFILHFPVNLDAVNEKESLINKANGMIIKPVLSKEKVNDFNIFTLPNSVGITTFISKNMKNAILKEDITGLDFLKAIVK
jgi:hypothetical protein